MKNTIKNIRILLSIFSEILINMFGAVLLFGVLALLVSMAMAAEIGVSVGQSKMGLADNGIWYQKGFPFHMNLKANAYRLFVNGKPFQGIEILGIPLDSLRVEGDYANYGMSSGHSQYVSDENYTGNAASPCYSPCEAPRSADWTGEASAFGLSLIPEIKAAGVLILPRLGYQQFRAKTTVTALNFHNAFIPDPNPSIGHYDENKTGGSWYLGIGVEYKGFKAEVTHSPLIKAGNDSIQRGITFWGISYQRSF